jgi:hypothetical protein
MKNLMNVGKVDHQESLESLEHPAVAAPATAPGLTPGSKSMESMDSFILTQSPDCFRLGHRLLRLCLN